MSPAVRDSIEVRSTDARMVAADPGLDHGGVTRFRVRPTDRRADGCSSLGAMDALLSAWFGENARDLPWRSTTDPYAILVSEVMLQQTQVERVLPRYGRWLERWPTVEALAAASVADVIREWQGLGYNRRALNLHRAACVVADTVGRTT